MIEPPQPDDVPAIEQIALQTGAFNPIDLSIIRELLESYFNPQPRDDHSFLVYRNGTSAPVGFACYGPTPLTDSVWDLYWIGVRTDYQKKGIGSALLETVEEAICRKGARAIYLDTSDTDDYARARSFYDRHGYRCLAHLDDFYAVGDGKVIYRKVFR